MRDEDIHIGDTLRIRSYEDMKSEFGVDKNGHITPVSSPFVFFSNRMINLCGRDFTVSSIVPDEYGGYCEYRSSENIEEYEDGMVWSILAWMLETCSDSEDCDVASDEEINWLLS